MPISCRIPALLFTIAAAQLAPAQDNSLAIFGETIASPAFLPFAGPGGGPRDRAERPQNNAPWLNDVLVYRTTAGGAVEKITAFERAGVPTVARLKDGRIIAAHQHFPADDPANFDKVAVHFSSDEGKTWTPAAVLQIRELPEGMRYPFDPTLVPLPDGRVRLYFTSLHGHQFDEDIPAIYSAISSDGVTYTFEPGKRFGIEGRNVIDCAVVLHQGTFHLFSPDNGVHLEGRTRPGEEPPEARPKNGAAYHATSPDGITFTRVDDLQLPGEGHHSWLGGAQSDGTQITFYGTGQPLVISRNDNTNRPGGGLWMATSTDGKTWQPALSPSVMGADPGAVTTTDGHLLIIATGEPQEGRERRLQQAPPQRDPNAFNQKSKF